MSETQICAQCGYVFPPGQDEPALAGLCPRCLAGGLGKESVEAELPPQTNNAATRIETIRTPLQPGATFKGFEVLEVLGQGGMGVVYKARQQSLNRLVALKLLNSQLASSEEFSKRFDREAKVLASLNHPNVVHVHDFGREEGLLYLVLEHVDGSTLEDLMKKKQAANLPKFLSAIRDVARGLQRVHEAGLVHRDIKPSNILLAKDGTAKISDFGLAVESEDAQKLTQSGMFVGTPHYVSPEHAQGKKVDGRSDLYSLGVILFEGFAGRPPFQAPSATALLLKHVNEPPPALYKLAPQSPKAVQEIVRKLLAKNPAARHDTAAALVRDLDRAVEELKNGPPVPATARKSAAPPATARKQAAPEGKKLPLKWIAAGGAAALLLLGLLIFAFSGKTEEKPSSLRQSSTVKHGTEPEKPKTPEPAPASVVEPAVPAPAQTPTPVPAQADPKPSTSVEDVLRQGDKLLDEARASYEEGKERASVESLAEAGFKAESARIKYQAVQEIGSEELKAKAAEQLKVIQQLLKLAHEARLSILNAKGENPAPPPVPVAPVPGVPSPVAPAPGPAMRPAAVVPAAPRRAPVPSATSQKDSEKQIRALFKDDYARKAAPDVQVFARKLLDQGAGVGNDDGARYVMLRDARDLAAQVGDLDTAMKAVDLLGQSFEIETVSLKVAAANKAAPQMRGVEGMAALAKAYLSIMEEGIASGQYDAALTVGPKAEAAARPAKDEILLARVLAVGKDLAFLQRESATARMSAKTLEQKPDDAAANLAAGRFACLGAGDWARGLPLLMKGSDAALRTAAEKEFAVTDDAASQIAAADAWWAAAEKERTPEYKKRMQSRAARWYLNVLPAANGLAKLQAEARLKQVGGLLLPPSLQSQRTDLVGGSGGASYNDVSREAGVLVGLRMSWVDQGLQVLKAVQPLFNSGSSLQEGPVRGKTPSPFKEVLAKPGYAVGGLVARGTNRVNGMKIIFMRISGIALDPRDSYESDWFGDKGNGEVRLGGDGTYVLGICGGAFEDVDSLGLLMLRKPTSGAAVLPAPAAPVSIGAGTPAPKGAIDLLALVDVSADAVAGEWKVEDGVLVALSGDHSRLQLPIVPPDEYDLKIVLERREGNDGIALGLAQGGAQWAFIVDKMPASGYRSGFEELDGQLLPGPAAVTGPRLTTGQPATFDLKVRKTSVTVAMNGQTLVSWQGNTNRFTNHARWQVPNPKALWLGQWWSRVHFSQITLTTVSGQGRLLRGGAGAAKGAIDLLPLIDPKQDSVRGVWKTLGGKICSPEPMEEVDELLQVPYVPPEEYDVTMVVERVSGTDGFGIGLSSGASTFMLVADSDFGRGTGLSLVDLKTANENETTWNGTLFKSTRPVTLQISVRRNSFSVTADGQPIIKWVPNYARCTLRERWATPNRGALSFCGLRGVYQVSRLSVVPISGPGMFLRKSAAAAPEGSGGPLPKGATDLLALVDPAADAVAGEWTWEGAQLVSTAGQHVRLQLPVIPPDEYDLKVVVERQEGVDGIAFGLAHGSSQWTVYVDKFPQEGSQTGLEMVDNGMATSVKGPQLVNGQPATFEFKVRKAGFTVLKDGKSLISWQGNYSRLSNFSRWEVRNNRALFLGQWSNRLRYSEIRLTAVSGEGRLLRGGAAPAAPALPKNAIDVLSYVQPVRDGFKGEWSRDKSALLSPGDTAWARLQVPFAPPAEYDLTLGVERRGGDKSFVLGIVLGGRPATIVIDGDGPGSAKITGLDNIGGQRFSANETSVSGPFLGLGRISTVAVSVRKGGVSLTIDGRTLFDWKGEASRLTIHDGWKTPTPEGLMVGCYETQFAIHQMGVVPVSGVGRKLR